MSVHRSKFEGFLLASIGEDNSDNGMQLSVLPALARQKIDPWDEAAGLSIKSAGLYDDATGGTDGWVSLEVSPLLADDPAGTVKAAVALHAQAQRRNLFIKIPGTRAGVTAIEEVIFADVPVNVTLLFSREHYVAAAEAYLRGIERRLAAGRDPCVGSVASLFVSRWDVAVKDRVPAKLCNRLGIAVAMRTYKAYREPLSSPRWQTLAASGATTRPAPFTGVIPVLTASTRSISSSIRAHG